LRAGSGFENGEESQAPGKNQRRHAEGLESEAARAAKKLHREEIENQIRGQQNQRLASFRGVERKVGRRLSRCQEKEEAQRYVERRP